MEKESLRAEFNRLADLWPDLFHVWVIASCPKGHYDWKSLFGDRQKEVRAVAQSVAPLKGGIVVYDDWIPAFRHESLWSLFIAFPPADPETYPRLVKELSSLATAATGFGPLAQLPLEREPGMVQAIGLLSGDNAFSVHEPTPFVWLEHLHAILPTATAGFTRAAVNPPESMPNLQVHIMVSALQQSVFRASALAIPSNVESFTPRVPTGPKPHVQLRGQAQKPIVCGKEVNQLTTPRYRVVEALLHAGPDGMSKSEIEKVNSDAVKFLRELHALAHWKKAINMPGSAWGKYGIVFE